MHAAEARARFLRDRVLTATAAQRVVMLYDRLVLDLTQAENSQDQAITHAMQILAELQASLDVTAGGPAPNLASLYTYLLRELIAVRGGSPERLAGVSRIVTALRESWAQVAAQAAAVPSDGVTSSRSVAVG